MAIPSVTYSFTNGSTSDATQINTNYTDLINSLTDGSADISIGTLTASGAVTFNGNVTLGNAAADDIVFTGAVESHIPFGTNATYDIGASTLAPRSIYLGNGTKTTRIIAGTIGTSWTFTLPNNVSATGQELIFNSSGTAEFRYSDKFTASKTTDYTATGDETIIPCAPAASMTVTLPAASTMNGKSLTIIKTDSDISKTVTIDGNASETINGFTTYVLYTQYESVTIKCDGSSSSWYIEQHFASTPWSSPTTITITGTTSNPTKGATPTHDKIVWRRSGTNAEIMFFYKNANAGSAGTGDYLFAMPTNLTIDTTNIPLYTTILGTNSPNPINIVGKFTSSLSTTAPNIGDVSVYSSTNVRCLVYAPTGDGAVSASYFGLNDSGVAYNAIFSVPISGWNA